MFSPSDGMAEIEISFFGHVRAPVVRQSCASRAATPFGEVLVSLCQMAQKLLSMGSISPANPHFLWLPPIRISKSGP